MRSRRFAAVLLPWLTLAAALPAAAAPPPEPLPKVAARTAGLERRPGLLVTYLDRQRGRIYLEVPKAAGPRGEVGSYLYVEGLLSGLGSNPVGLDRGQLGDTRVVTLRRVGDRLLVEQQNLAFRALTDRPEELRAVRESFAPSVLWAGEIAALDPDGRALVDLTPFLVRDAHDVVATLKTTGQGSWSLDAARSALDPEACLAFPENLEFEALLTYQSAEPGEEVRRTAPSPSAITLVQHHSLLRLPDAGYTPRRYDPRAGSFDVRFFDYAAPLAAPVETRWIVRHRLEKVDPAAATSPAKEPIVFHVDPGVPEPVRSALVEGASWWAQAFAAAGFENAYRVELLPADAHPLDARYNVIQWVHRATRGWSYGGGVVDPRTGEMVKGHVTLGSLRVRQDRLLFEGLVGADATGTGGANDPLVYALARIRQLAAHEVGHALGFAHNFAASTYGRASVMDYPAPLVRVTAAGELDLSQAYAAGAGAWDKHAARYAYSQFPPGADEAAALAAIVQEGLAQGLLSSATRTPAPPARRTRSPTSGTTASTPRPGSSRRWQCAPSPSPSSVPTTSPPAGRWPGSRRCWRRSTSTTATSSKRRPSWWPGSTTATPRAATASRRRSRWTRCGSARRSPSSSRRSIPPPSTCPSRSSPSSCRARLASRPTASSSPAAPTPPSTRSPPPPPRRT